MNPAISSTIEARRAQTFPLLTADEIERMRRFGKPRRFAEGEPISRAARRARACMSCSPAAIRITHRDIHGQNLQW